MILEGFLWEDYLRQREVRNRSTGDRLAQTLLARNPPFFDPSRHTYAMGYRRVKKSP